MKKYTITYNVIVSHEIEVEANSLAEAKEMANFDYIPKSDVIQDYADSFSSNDLSSADVEVESIFSEDGKEEYYF